MNKAPFVLSESIRTIASDNLLKNVSLKRMHNRLIDLFYDRTANDKPRNLLESDGMKKAMQFNHCNRINDARRIEFGNSFKQANDVFNEDKQMWIDPYIDVEKDDLFIPRDDAQ